MAATRRCAFRASSSYLATKRSCGVRGRLIIEPASPGSLIALLATLEPIEEDLEAPPDRPPEPVDF
jgi:hypothetical protein